jgi:hypothetical protein
MSAPAGAARATADHVDDGAQTVPAHRRRGAREHCRRTARERPRSIGLRQQLGAMAASEPQERGRAEEAGVRAVEGSA